MLFRTCLEWDVGAWVLLGEVAYTCLSPELSRVVSEYNALRHIRAVLWP